MIDQAADRSPWQIDIANVSAEIAHKGVSVLQNMISVAHAAALLAYCKSHIAWHAAGIGAAHTANLNIRGDRSHWLDSETNAIEAEVLSKLNAFRCALNQTLWLNLATVEAHFAHYAPGTGYAQHKDVFHHDAQRVISLVIYLNPAWQRADGGRLLLHLREGVQFVAPQSGTAVVFVSAETEHSVERTTLDRYSIAAWFKRGM